MSERLRTQQEPSRLRRGARATVDYFRVSPQLHAVNALFLTPVSFLTYALGPRALFSGAIVAPVLAINTLKTGEILKKYNRIKTTLERAGWNERLIAPMMGYWCDRYAARKAAIDAGYRPEVKRYYKEQGNSWLTYKYSPRRSSTSA